MIETIVLGWDERPSIFNRGFLKNQDCVAEGVVRARILKRSGGSVTPKEVVALSGITSRSPSLPDRVLAWP
jgi:hypothetical protein